ncbi:MAG: citrate synthase family protein [Chloroflexota bacterium]
MAQPSYLSAQEAAEELKISVATLYSYVSRGLIRSEATQEKSRAKRYSAADVQKLKQKQDYRRNPGQAAQASIHWGMPVLDSSITLIENGQLYYRGRNALELSETKLFEVVAAYLWTGSFAADHLFNQRVNISYFQNQPLAQLSPIERFQHYIPLIAAQDLAGYDTSPQGVQQTGARVLQTLTAIVTGQSQFESIASALQKAWAPDNLAAQRPIEAALILCADHELNVSAFTARCIASAGSTLYQVVLGGLSALQGKKHGGHTTRVQAMLDEITGDVVPKLTSIVKRGDEIPGFWQPLYPDGDPRGRKLIQLAEGFQVDGGALAEARSTVEFVTEHLGRYPNLDFGLVTLSRTLQLPAEAPLIIFALGRISGWIAHALEQYSSDELIRPRARYVGLPVDG